MSDWLTVVPPPVDDLPYYGAPDRNRYLVDGKAVVLCVPCARDFDTELFCVCSEDDCHCCETDEACAKCGAGEVLTGEQLAML